MIADQIFTKIRKANLLKFLLPKSKPISVGTPHYRPSNNNFNDCSDVILKQSSVNTS